MTVSRWNQRLRLEDVPERHTFSLPLPAQHPKRTLGAAAAKWGGRALGRTGGGAKGLRIGQALGHFNHVT